MHLESLRHVDLEGIESSVTVGTVSSQALGFSMPRCSHTESPAGSSTILARLAGARTIQEPHRHCRAQRPTIPQPRGAAAETGARATTSEHERCKTKPRAEILDRLLPRAQALRPS